MLLWPQRYLDEAEREKQQYMKELREYQQSEAYKMCTEKIQEKKIKKGVLRWCPLLGMQPGAAGGGPGGGLLGVTCFLLTRGRRLCGSKHPAERAPAQGEALRAVWGN